MAVGISIHAAREGGDMDDVDLAEFKRFQSTPPVKAATLQTDDVLSAEEFQSTPPVKAATISHIGFWGMLGISIHAAREGGDL